MYTLKNTNNKTRVLIEKDTHILYSYNTKVATYNTDTKEVNVLGYYSATTGRHINAFFTHFNLPTQTKKELFKNFNLKK